MRSAQLVSAAFLLCCTQPALAAVCDYRPSALVGGAGVAAGATAGVAGSAGAAGTVAGFYTLVHATSGLTMLGSTMAGASAAGTVGIVGGTAGAVGTSAAILLNPLVWVPALVVGVGTLGYEGACYFSDDRITDREDILLILRDFAAHSELGAFVLDETDEVPYIALRGPDNAKVRYDIDTLYIVNGVLISRDWGPNTTIGRVVFVAAKPGAEDEAAGKPPAGASAGTTEGG